MNDKLIAPTVHLNGSGKASLMEQYKDAYVAIRAAQEALPRPHARDYYVQADGAFEQARKQYEAQSAALAMVEDQLGEIAQAIMAQGK